MKLRNSYVSNFNKYLIIYGMFVFIYYSEKPFQSFFLILKALKDILEHFKFCELVNSWFRFFDVTNR